MPAQRDEPSAPPQAENLMLARCKAEKVTLAGIVIGLGPIGTLVPAARGIRFPYCGDGTWAVIGGRLIAAPTAWDGTLVVVGCLRKGSEPWDDLSTAVHQFRQPNLLRLRLADLGRHLRP